MQTDTQQDLAFPQSHKIAIGNRDRGNSEGSEYPPPATFKTRKPCVHATDRPNGLNKIT